MPENLANKRTTRAVQDSFTQYMMKEYKHYNYAKFYTFTISPHQLYAQEIVTHQAASQILSSYKCVYSLRYIIETSDKGKIHAHGILVTRDLSKFVKLRRHPMVNYHFSYYNVDGGWLDYIAKDDPKDIHGYHNNPIGNGTSQHTGKFSSDIQQHHMVL